MKKISFLIFALFLFLLQTNISFATIASSGFIEGALWYSPATFEEGDTVSIHTATWNEGPDTLSGTIQFLDDTTILGSRDISVPPKTLKDTSIQWKVTAGTHQISVKIIGAHAGTDKSQTVTLASNAVSDKSIFITKKITVASVEKGAIDTTNSIGAKVAENIPTSVSVPIENGTAGLDNFRQNISDTLDKTYNDTKKTIDSFSNKISAISGKTAKNSEAPKSSSSISGVEKPITYVKLFLVGLCLFIFSHKFIFYLLLVIIVFIILRFIWRKIRSKGRSRFKSR